MVSSCGLIPTVPVSVVVTAESTTTRVRRQVFSESASDGENRIWIDLKPTELGGTLVLSTFLVLTASMGERGLGATRPGSVLWKDVERVALEGDAARFPISLISFSENGLPTHAPWRIDIRDTDLEVPVTSTASVLVNADHKAAAAMAHDPDGSAPSRRLADALKADIALRMLEILRTSKEVGDSGSFPEGSLGEALMMLREVLLPMESVDTIQSAHHSEVARIEAELLGALRVYSS
jgi:hypothetical protein